MFGQWKEGLPDSVAPGTYAVRLSAAQSEFPPSHWDVRVSLFKIVQAFHGVTVALAHFTLQNRETAWRSERLDQREQHSSVTSGINHEKERHWSNPANLRVALGYLNRPVRNPRPGLLKSPTTSARSKN